MAGFGKGNKSSDSNLYAALPIHLHLCAVENTSAGSSQLQWLTEVSRGRRREDISILLSWMGWREKRRARKTMHIVVGICHRQALIIACLVQNHNKVDFRIGYPTPLGRGEIGLPLSHRLSALIKITVS